MDSYNIHKSPKRFIINCMGTFVLLVIACTPLVLGVIAAVIADKLDQRKKKQEP
jgi:hypothetical protein